VLATTDALSMSTLPVIATSRLSDLEYAVNTQVGPVPDSAFVDSDIQEF